MIPHADETGVATVSWELHTCTDLRTFDRMCLACQDRSRMRGHYMRKVVETRLDAAVQWIAGAVVGDGRIRAGLPRELRGELADVLVSDPQYGWPDTESALADLDADEQFEGGDVRGDVAA